MQVAAGSPAGCDAMFAATVPRLLPLIRAPETAAAERLAPEMLLTLVKGVREGLPAMPPPADPAWRPFKVPVRPRHVGSKRNEHVDVWSLYRSMWAQHRSPMHRCTDVSRARDH